MSYKIASIVSPDTVLDLTGSTYQVRVEEIPADQLTVDPKNEYLLPVAHFHRVKFFILNFCPNIYVLLSFLGHFCDVWRSVFVKSS